MIIKLIMSKVTLKQMRDGMKEGIVVFFVHASWCPFTINFYPIFDNTMKKMHETKADKHFSVIRIDDNMVRSLRANYGDIYRKLADYDEDVDEYKLSFPTVIMFVNGKRYKYQVSVRTVKNLEEFILSKLPKRRREQSNIRQNTPHKVSSISSRKHMSLHEQIDKAFKRLFR